MSSLIRKFSLIAAIGTVVALGVHDPAFAQRRGGGMRGGGMRGGGGGFRGGGGGFSRGGMSRGGGFSRAAARPSVTRPSFGGGMNRSVARPSTPNIANRPGAVGGNNVTRRGNAIGNGNNRVNNRPINVGDVDINGGYGWGGYGYRYPVGAGVVAGAAITAAAIGSTVYTLPSDCSTTVVNGVTYTQCGSTWYQPQFDGETTTYVVVNAPQ